MLPSIVDAVAVRAFIPVASAARLRLDVTLAKAAEGQDVDNELSARPVLSDSTSQTSENGVVFPSEGSSDGVAPTSGESGVNTSDSSMDSGVGVKPTESTGVNDQALSDPTPVNLVPAPGDPSTGAVATIHPVSSGDGVPIQPIESDGSSNSKDSDTKPPAAVRGADPSTAPQKTGTAATPPDAPAHQASNPAAPPDNTRPPDSPAASVNGALPIAMIPVISPPVDARTIPANAATATNYHLAADAAFILLASETKGPGNGASSDGSKGGSSEEDPSPLLGAENELDAQEMEVFPVVENVGPIISDSNLAPQGHGLLGSGFALDLPSVEQSITQFFDKLDHLGSQLIAVQEKAGLSPWLVAAIATGAALEISRRQFRPSRMGEDAADNSYDINLNIGLGG
jgi:hypothetical protein